MKFFLAIILSILLFTSISYSQGSRVQKHHPFSGTIVLTIEGGPTFESTDFNGTGIDYYGKASLEYFIPAYSISAFGFRIFGGGGFISGKDNRFKQDKFRTKLGMIGGGVVYIFSFGESFFPYLFAGVSNLWFDPVGVNNSPLPNNKAGLYKKSEVNYNGELGFRFKVTDNLTINLNGGVQISPNDNLDDISLGTSNDLFFTAGAGFSFSFLTEMDSDGDGVVDSKDMCGDTPSGTKVDKFGCPLDTDNDGVYDYLDKCPDTPKDVRVDRNGCPLNSDGDNVPDYLDLCPDTPAGISVDEFGCPYDHDADGIPDYEDKCPNTPYDVSVDKNGCPLDSDLDGVPDYLDQCPETAPGKLVDKYGCPLIKKEKKEVKEVKEIVLSGETNFAFNSSRLLPSAYPELDKLVKYMKENPTSRWRIEGHTDNIGSDAGNKKISLKRATAVMNYFVSKGIDKSRFEVIGLGKDFPIASNKTEQGRAKNRRVVIIRLN